MVEKAKCDVVREGVTLSNYRESELLLLLPNKTWLTRSIKDDKTHKIEAQQIGEKLTLANNVKVLTFKIKEKEYHFEICERCYVYIIMTNQHFNNNKNT